MKKVKFDYRHIFCIFITIGFILCSIFVFPYAFGRLTESLRDFSLSVAYYFSELLELDNNVVPSVCNFSEYPFVVPFNLPDSWEKFQSGFAVYWSKFQSEENFNNYLIYLGDIAYVLCQIFLLIMPFFYMVIFFFNNNYITV